MNNERSEAKINSEEKLGEAVTEELQESKEETVETFKPVTDVELKYLASEMKEQGWSASDLQEKLSALIEEDPQTADLLKEIDRRRREEFNSLETPLRRANLRSSADVLGHDRTLSDIKALLSEAEEWTNLPEEEKLNHAKRKDYLSSYGEKDVNSQNARATFNNEIRSDMIHIAKKIAVINNAIETKQKLIENRDLSIIQPEFKLSGIVDIPSGREYATVDMDADLRPLAEKLQIPIEEVEEARARVFQESEAKRQEMELTQKQIEEEKITSAFAREQRRNIFSLKQEGIITQEPENQHAIVDMDANLASLAESLGVPIEKLEEARTTAFEENDKQRKEGKAKPAKRKGGIGRFLSRSKKE